MAENQHSDQRNRRQGGGQNRRRNNYNNRRDGDSGPRTEHETYRREGSGTDYTPPRESRKTTFGGGEYERVYRDKPAPKAPLAKRILGFLTFGLLGKDKPAPAKPAPGRGGKPAAQGNTPRNDRPRRERNGDRPERGERRGGGDRGPRNNERGERPARENRRPAESTNTQTGPREPRQKQERSPQPVDLAAITTPRLHVGNLSYDTVESDLFELFSGIGKVTNAEIVTHSRTQRSKGFGFVQLTSVEDAKRAAEELHGKPFMGRVLMVGPAKGNKPASAEGNPESETQTAPE